MRKKTMIILALSITLTIVCVAYYFFTPKRVIEMAVKDVKKDGLEGLQPYLTDDMKGKLDDLIWVKNLPLSQLILNKADDLGVTDVVVHQIEKVDWKVDDVRVGLKAAEIELVYQYGKYTGRADLTMQFEKGVWKIAAIDIPLIDSVFSLKSVIGSG